MRLPTFAPIELDGLIDLHVHSAPDIVPRFADDIDAASAAEAAGMRAILLKSHACLTADRATIAQKLIESTVLATDFGQLENPAPVDGMRAYLAGLHQLSFSRRELERMAGDTPAWLLGLK